MTFSHRCTQAAFLFIILTGASGKQPDPGDAYSESEWAAMARRAHTVVSSESPPSAIPINPTESGSSGPIVIAHYFPPFPLSIGDVPASQDYYATQFLQKDGEKGKFLVQRGFLRERPLPVDVAPANEYEAANLAIDVARAQHIGIDAFGVDLLVINAGKLWQTTLLLLDAAEHVSSSFKILPEPDMTALKTATVDTLADALTTFADHAASYHLSDGRMLVMPFAAETRDPLFWSTLVARMAARRRPIALVPDYVDGRNRDAMSKIAWASTVWGNRDAEAASNPTTVASGMAKLGTERWFMPVSPQDYRPKNGQFWETKNSEAFRNEWMSAIKLHAAGIHLITWNDYSESSEISPSSFTQYVFYDLSAYYISWAKKGYPPKILRDALFYIQRNQLFDPNNRNRGPVQTLRGGTRLANDIEVVAFLTKPATLRISCAGKTVSRDIRSGLQTIRIAAAVGKPSFEMIRDGRVLISKSSDWSIDPDPERHDATYGGGSSLRQIVKIP